MAEGFRTITLEKAGRAAVLTLRRPEAKNAVNRAMCLEIVRALEAVEADPEVLVGVLAAEGDVFCAGMDLKEYREGHGEAICLGPELAAPEEIKLTGLDMLGDLVSRSKKGGAAAPRAGFAGFVRYPRAKPFIAAVQGPALAGGFELVLACDMVVAAPGARFGLPEPGVGLFAAAGGAFRLPARIPAARAMELLLTGAPMDAAEARALGLVNHVADPAARSDAAEAVRFAALELAARISRNAPPALRETFNLARAARDRTETAFWEENARALRRIILTPDADEGTRAFVEKRRPEWQS
ncbi:MAG: enoyl-CoA hydratase-related protein [Desulfovibrionaceae bacterium]